MKDAKYKWTHTPFDQKFVVYKWVDGSTVHPWSRHVPGRWLCIHVFRTTDAEEGRRHCERLIEGISAKTVTFYYDKDGRQLPGFDIE